MSMGLRPGRAASGRTAPARRHLACALACLLLTAGARAQVSGTVRDSQTGQPIANAEVRVQATTQFTTTAADGAFSLNVGPGATVTLGAGKLGYWNKGTTVVAPAQVALFLDPLPAGDDASYSFKSPASCNFCHQNVYSQWFQAPMAHSGQNLWLHDLYAGNGTPGGQHGFVYTRDSKHKVSNPDGDCAWCHAPVMAAANPGLETPLTDPQNPGPGQEDSVSCDLCHRIESVNLTTALNVPGVRPEKVTFRRPNGSTQPIMFGPWADAVFEAPAMRPAFNPLFRGPELCAVCHQDNNDHDGDGDYQDPGSISHQNTYAEWLASPYAQPGPEYKDCRTCHMAAAGDTQVCSFGPQRDPATIAGHHFLGTTPEFLEKAVDMALVARRAGGSIEVKVQLTNTGAGHAVPTGSDFRNLILLVDAYDAQDNELPSTGTQVVNLLGGFGDPSQGDYFNHPGKLYGRVNFDGTLPAQFFSEAVAIALDDRLFPGKADVTHYRFAAPATGPVRVEARLIYRKAWRHWTKVKRWHVDGQGNPNADVAPPWFGQVMEAARTIVH